MRYNHLSTRLFLLALCIPFGCIDPGAQGAGTEIPQVFVLDGKHLAAVRERLKSNDARLELAVGKLEKEAEAALGAGPFTIVDEFIPVSGNKHDYMSQAPYFWRNPNTPDGLPYIRRDGERNPEINKYPDHRLLDQMVDAVETLALGYFFKGEEKYARKAAELLWVWFLDPATRMNPNLQHAQAIPGITSGRGIGIIESRGLTRVVDAIGLLAGSRSWTSHDQDGLQAWFRDYLQWLLESKNGRDEAAAKNNHGTYYDLQVMSFALFTGKKDLARQIASDARQKRIATQIEPDGRQPLELARTRAWSYSTGNLQGLMTLARLAEHAGVDLWNFETADGRSLRQALEYLLPFGLGEKPWPHPQINGFSERAIHPLVRRAARKYSHARYEKIAASLPSIEPDSRQILLQP
ncbi:MAG: alginate lyase family protein [Verrucomicrobiota bacterium]